MKRLIFTIVALGFCLFAKAQIALDTISTEALNELLIEQVERLAEDGDEDADYEMMEQLLSNDNSLSFEDICNDWLLNFNTQDRDILSDIYQDTRISLGIDDDDFFMNDDDDDSGEIIFDLPPLRKVT